MKKIMLIGFLMLFVHSLILLIMLGRLDTYISQFNETNVNPIFGAISWFMTFVIYVLIVILFFIEMRNESNYKGVIMFLVLSNCFQEFYINAFYQFQLFSRPQSYDLMAKIIVLSYFAIEFCFSFYVLNRLYKN